MHILFVHRNFPAQFGHIAARLVEQGHRCTFVSETPEGTPGGITKIQYRPAGGAKASTHLYSRTFENAVWHAAGVYDALSSRRSLPEPDLIVGHAGFGSTILLPELYPDAPIINYFEYFYRPHHSDIDFRTDLWPVSENAVLRSRVRNAMILLDLENCRAGYSPTTFQRNLFPAAYQPKLRVLHDGIDTTFWRRRNIPDRTIGRFSVGPDTRLVTYVSRGLESMRGFDIFMRLAKRICDKYPNVLIVMVGSDRVAYAGDLQHVPERTFKDWVLKQDDYDLSRILFVGRVARDVLASLLSLSDLHVYLTVPFVLSWSLLNAMACGCTILASDTAPVREFIEHSRNGLLTDFFDVDGMATMALDVLKDPDARRPLGHAARRTIEEHYDLELILPRTAAFYQEVAGSPA